MKLNLATLLILVAILSGCKSNGNEDQKLDFEGNWLLKEVIANTQSFRSVKKAVDLSDFYVTELAFDLSGDSVTVCNGQEGFVRLPVETEANGRFISIRNDVKSPLLFDESDSTILFADSTLNRVYRFFRSEKKYVDTSFTYPVAFPSYVNEALISGRWENEEIGKVDFGLFGTIKNWQNYTNYEIVVNGEYAINQSSDMIILKSSDNAQLFGFKRGQDTIQFFDLIPSSDGEEYKNGRMLYEFRQ